MGPIHQPKRKWASLRHVNGVAVYQEEAGPHGEGGAFMISAVVRSTPRACAKVRWAWPVSWDLAPVTSVTRHAPKGTALEAECSVWHSQFPRRRTALQSILQGLCLGAQGCALVKAMGPSAGAVGSLLRSGGAL